MSPKVKNKKTLEVGFLPLSGVPLFFLKGGRKRSSSESSRYDRSLRLNIRDWNFLVDISNNAKR